MIIEVADEDYTTLAFLDQGIVGRRSNARSATRNQGEPGDSLGLLCRPGKSHSYLTPMILRKEKIGPRLGSLCRPAGWDANDHMRATVEKTKHHVREKSFIPCDTRSYATRQHPARTEFRHDSCNTAPI
jgi:hypothetical protein